MSASNIFGRGISEKKMEPILESFPDILTSSESSEEKIKKVTTIKGMAKKTAELFVNNIPAFLNFVNECGLDEYLKKAEQKDGQKVQVDESNPLYKKSIVMTGFRDESLTDALKSVGAKLGSSVSKNTFAVLIQKNVHKLCTKLVQNFTENTFYHIINQPFETIISKGTTDFLNKIHFATLDQSTQKPHKNSFIANNAHQCSTGAWGGLSSE
jgi:NAD-dependent DNA ligase